ncbi:MAG: ATP-binding protein [Gammaproteobacteria bacterium]|nr:ATP-binding protein [Gammaproteobacteria bacterium]
MQMNGMLLESLLHHEEGPALDFKQAQYPIDKGSTPEDKANLRGELVKDILAMANASREGTGYILIGVEEIKGGRSRIIGVQNHLDDANLHQLINSKTQRPVEFSYFPFSYKGSDIGVIEIPVQDRFLFLTQDYGRLHENVVYIRDGSSTRTATPDEVIEMSTPKPPQLVLEWVKPDSGETLPSPCLVSSLFYDPLLPEDTFKQRQNLSNMQVMDSLNPNYSREIIAFARDKAFYKPLGMRLHNTGRLAAQRVRYIGWMDKTAGACVKEELSRLPSKSRDPFNSWESMYHPSLGPMDRVCADPEADLYESAEDWQVIIDFGDIRPGEIVYMGSPLWFGSSCSHIARLEGELIGDNIPNPIEVALDIQFDTKRRPMTKEDGNSCERAHLETLGIDEE